MLQHSNAALRPFLFILKCLVSSTHLYLGFVSQCARTHLYIKENARKHVSFRWFSLSI